MDKSIQVLRRFSQRTKLDKPSINDILCRFYQAFPKFPSVFHGFPACSDVFVPWVFPKKKHPLRSSLKTAPEDRGSGAARCPLGFSVGDGINGPGVFPWIYMGFTMIFLEFAMIFLGFAMIFLGFTMVQVQSPDLFEDGYPLVISQKTLEKDQPCLLFESPLFQRGHVQ